MEKKYIDFREWMGLPRETRLKLVVAFSIPKHGQVMTQSGVNGSTVLTDGHTITDLEAISIETMQNYTGLMETDFYKLFNKVLEKINPPVEEEEDGSNEEEVIITKPKKDAKPKTKKRKQDKGTTGEGNEDTAGGSQIS